ncbi:hypothetical protein Enr13x_53040 [Stieleria neptunia]|uniref:HEAT repeat protein n=1 Tax=Stieleria neptunia TaxID=2527979 RepID=A0A518HX36_9BACT|nr:HEAT repeat domain-containing protein [Stieleria neptunia]QDV45425.1 hypothetical protein Enr13x_53040 [Stieleria neptunia]
MRRFFRFRIVTLLLLILAASITAAWIVDRERLLARIEDENHPISYYVEKHSYWSPASYLGGDTDTYESELSGKLAFSGNKVVSSQGMGSPTLRQPDIATLNQTIGLLDSTDLATRLSAARLLALYLQAVSGSGNLDTDSVSSRVHFQAVGVNRVRQLIRDSDADVRAAVALILGNTLYDRHTVTLMKQTFDEEQDQTVKLHLAWAYWKIGHNYDKAEYYVNRSQGKAGPSDSPKDRALRFDNGDHIAGPR